MSKPCTVCKQVLPLESFANQATGKLGKRASCKQCVKSTYKHSKEVVVEAVGIRSLNTLNALNTLNTNRIIL